MRLEYFEGPGSQTPLLLVYGNDPDAATVLRRVAEQFAAGDTGADLRIDQLPGFVAVDGCSLVAGVGVDNRGVEAVTDAARAFRAVLRPATWENIAGLVEPFETPREDHAHQYLDATGPVTWIISSDRSW